VGTLCHNNIGDELPKLLEEKFLKNKKHYDSRKKQIRFVVGEKLLVKIENKGSKFAYRYKYQMLHTKLINDYKNVSHLKKFLKIEKINK